MPVTLEMLGGQKKQSPMPVYGFAYKDEQSHEFADPVVGALGWLPKANGVGRYQCQFNGAFWEEYFERHDDGF